MFYPKQNSPNGRHNQQYDKQKLPGLRNLFYFLGKVDCVVLSIFEGLIDTFHFIVERISDGGSSHFESNIWNQKKESYFKVLLMSVVEDLAWIGECCC